MRVLNKIVQEIAKENSWQYNAFNDDWIIELRSGDKNCFIIGYVFENNNSATTYLLKDKSGVYDVLSYHGIDAVEHVYFYKNIKDVLYKNNRDYITIHNMLNKYGAIVIKDNNGTGGSNVYRVENEAKLTEVLQKITNKFDDFSASPFYNIEHEYRVIVQGGEPKVMYEKIRPFVVGDGLSTIKQLVITKFGDNISIDSDIDQKYVAKKGEIMLLNWKHNLGLGATPIDIEDNKVIDELNKITKEVTKLLKINLASVDIVYTNNTYKILEINGGVMMEKWASASGRNYKIAKDIYRSALQEILPINE